ncbi:hypothetical protein DFJ73DRAFT_823704 [Zopfochytrium polystomum]|nr:hypothetical protein DFJ73DRAFT_823704 [Zopfochytrium polystomum]
MSPGSEPSLSYIRGLKRRWSCETCRRRKLRCDGNRPTCSYCVSRRTACVYVGSRVRAEFDMEKAAKIEKEKTLRRAVGIPETPSPQEDGLDSPELEAMPPFSVAVDLIHSLSLDPIEALSFQLRPGAREDEEYSLSDIFFKTTPLVSGVLHKRTYLLNYLSMPAYLRLAVCAAGAANPTSSSVDREKSEWYSHEALKRLEVALLEPPRLECLQALMIVPPTRLCCPATLHVERMTNLALMLRLHIDPDYLPECARSSWHEKEARRRCWWYLFVTDHMMVTTLLDKPAMSRHISTVKPVCPERLWTSMKPPESLETLYEVSRGVNDNPLNWHVMLVEIFQRVFQLSRPADGLFDDSLDRRGFELQLEVELVAWWDMVPTAFWDVESEERVRSLMEEDPYHWQTVMDLYFTYHGCVCLLMRRKALLHLHSLSDAATVSSPAQGPLWVIDEIAKQNENESAFKKAVASAESMAAVVSFLNKANVFWHKLPKSTIFFSQQGVLTLFIAQWVYSAMESSNGDDSTEDGFSTAAAEPTGNPEAGKPLSKWIDAYISFLDSMSKSVTRRIARLFHKFMAKVRSGDWEYIDKLERSQGLVLDELHLPAGLFDDTSNSSAPATAVPQAGAFSPTVSPSSVRLTAGAGATLVPSHVSPYLRACASVGITVREYIKTLKAARDIGWTLTPAPTPFMRATSGASLQGARADAFFLSLPEMGRASLIGPSGAIQPHAAMPLMGWFDGIEASGGGYGDFGGSGSSDEEDGVESEPSTVGVHASGVAPLEDATDGYTMGLYSEAVDTFRYFTGKDGSAHGMLGGQGIAQEGQAGTLLDWLLSGRSDGL